ncbi:MAG: serine/threonine-protein kinase [Myxococcota bacterium]
MTKETPRDDLQPIIGRYRVADADADAELARNSVRARLFGGKKKKTRLGKYVLGKLVGVGGMGRVYVAHDRELDRKVALKLLKGSQWTGAGGEEGRLWREARTLAQISHRNVVSVYEVGEAEMGVFVAMEFIDGRTLRRWVNDEDPSPQMLLQVLRDAGTGLAAAHAAGIVHRDFKPDNVLIGNDGRVCVVDFGIAHDVSSLPDVKFAREDFMTTTGREALLTSGPAGTPAYMAPERLDGRNADVAGDIYSFCVSTWEALTGYLPDPYTDAPPPDPRRVVPRGLRAALERGLSHDPAVRQPTMRKLLDAFDGQLHRKSRRKLWLTGGGVLLAGVAAGALLRTPTQELPSSETQEDVLAATPPVVLPSRSLAQRVTVAEDLTASAPPFAGSLRLRIPDTALVTAPNDPTALAPAWAPTLSGHDLDARLKGGAAEPVLVGQGIAPFDGVAVDDPAAYVAHARLLNAIAARYGGSSASPISSLAHGRATIERPSPPAFAAMASAAYDGHRGALGVGVGVKAADAGLPVVLEGFGGRMHRPSRWPNTTVDYLAGVLMWSRTHRDGSFPGDVIGVHVQPRDPQRGAAFSPEDADLAGAIGHVARWRDANLPDRELWVSTFGYDTHPESTQRVWSDDAGSSLGRLHAAWTVRATLLLLAGGADRVHLARHVDAASTSEPGDTSGLRGPLPDADAKPALRVMSTLLDLVGDHRVDGMLDGMPEHVWAIQLSGPERTQAVVAWLDTHDGARRDGVSLPFTPMQVTITPLDGVSRSETPQGALVLDVTEMPVVAVWQRDAAVP